MKILAQSLSLTLILTLSPLSWSQPELLNPTYRQGDKGLVLHSGRLKNPSEFEFNRGNKLRFQNEVLFHDNGSLWMARASEGKSFVRWILPGGQTISLNCNQPPTVNGQVNPTKYIIFHSNRELKSGCRLGPGFNFFTRKGEKIEVHSLSQVDFNSEGFLSYAQRILRGRIQLRGQKIGLAPQSSVSFHDSGEPHFFKMKGNEIVRLNTRRLGQIQLVQKSSRPIYTQFNQKGQLESGLVGNSLTLDNIAIPKESGLSFEKLSTLKKSSPQQDQRELTVVLAEPQSIKLSDQMVILAQLKFNSKNKLIGAVNATAFNFLTPEGKVIPVPLHSRIFVRDRVITRIDFKL